MGLPRANVDLAGDGGCDEGGAVLLKTPNRLFQSREQPVMPVILVANPLDYMRLLS